VLLHGDAIIDRAHQLAEITAYTLFFLDGISIVGLAVSEVNGLVRSILAGDITKPAMNAFILVDFGDDMKIDVEVFPVSKRFY
jgi:hypothetical protein